MFKRLELIAGEMLRGKAVRAVVTLFDAAQQGSHASIQSRVRSAKRLGYRDNKKDRADSSGSGGGKESIAELDKKRNKKQ